MKINSSWATLVLGGALAVVGCSFPFGDSSNNYSDWDDDGGDAPVCRDYCSKLIECGVWEEVEKTSCKSECNRALQNASVSVQQGCECVIYAECGSFDITQCPQAPFPELFESSSSTGSAGSANTSGAAGSASH